MAESPVKLSAIEKSYGDNRVVANLDLEVRPAEFVTLLGPSGCGKTTTLNIVAGFVTPDSGTVRLQGREVTHAPTFERDIGLVFQDYAIFPHMTVADNIAFGLKMRKRPAAEIAKRVSDALDLVRLQGLGARMPQALSGGQRQRVALARALVINPTVLLLDEPMSNLDLKLREEMRLEISRLQRRLGIPTILVTHDQSEALAVSDRIAVMNGGRIEQIGTPTEIYGRPATRFVAEFIGSMNFLAGSAVEAVEEGEQGLVRVGAAAYRMRAAATLFRDNAVAVAVRPERCALSASPGVGPDVLSIAGRVVQQVYLGSNVEVYLATDVGPCVVTIPGDGKPADYATGSEWFVTAKTSDCAAFLAPSA